MLTVYGIPTCGTVQKAVAWLKAQGLPYTYVDLRAAPPDAARIARWVGAFGVVRLKNTSGGSYRALGAEKDGWDHAAWQAAYARDPMLIKRPVIEKDGAPALVGWTLGEDELRRILG